MNKRPTDLEVTAKRLYEQHHPNRAMDWEDLSVGVKQYYLEEANRRLTHQYHPYGPT